MIRNTSMLRAPAFKVLDAQPEPESYFGDLEMPAGELKVAEFTRRMKALPEPIREDKLLRLRSADEDIRKHLRAERIVKGVFWTCVITALGSLAVLKILGLL